MIYLAVLLFAIAILLFWKSGNQRKAAGLPGGRIIYADTSHWGAPKEPLYAPALGLTGKPDYLVEKGNRLIPVEVKTTRLPEAPYDSHIYQLAAYCLLVQHEFGKRPPYGILHYTDGSKSSRTFAIDFTPALEATVLDTIEEMRAKTLRKEVNRSHQSPERCARCGYRNSCDDSL